MLCSVCHKNMAVIFTKKIDGNKTSTEGLCMDCARAKGINPIDILVKQANLSEDEICRGKYGNPNQSDYNT